MDAKDIQEPCNQEHKHLHQDKLGSEQQDRLRDVGSIHHHRVCREMGAGRRLGRQGFGVQRRLVGHDDGGRMKIIATVSKGQ
jgi:hypothetical protein